MSTLHSRLTRIALQELTGQAYVTVEDAAMAMAAAILNNAEGYAVVELPESTDTGDLPDEGWWKSFPEGVSATGPNGRVFDQDADIAPTEARSLAASLLAAANAAEAGA